jgi:hypothetical protein
VAKIQHYSRIITKSNNKTKNTYHYRERGRESARSGTGSHLTGDWWKVKGFNRNDKGLH